MTDSMEVVLRGKDTYIAGVTDTSLGTIRSLETTAPLAESIRIPAEQSSDLSPCGQDSQRANYGG